MMNLEVMRRLVAESEEGEKRSETAHQALAHWQADADSLQEFRYSANAIYIFRCDGEVRFLRLTHDAARTKTELAAELALIEHFNASGLRAARPVSSQTGSLIEEVTSEVGHFYAVVFEAAHGKQLEAESLTDVQIRAWGETMAKFHLAAEQLNAKGTLARRDWRAELALFESWLPEEDEDARRMFSEAAAWLASLPAGAQDAGLIHYDFELDNLFWDGAGFTVIDLDDAALYPFAADIAFAFDDVFELPQAARERVVDGFLDGYRSERPLSDEWVERIHLFVKLMRLLKFTRVLHSLEGARPELDPEWLKGLRGRFQQRVEAARASMVGQSFMVWTPPE
ncbi:MAG: phosphotransferase [Anaerolineaceae bacterium]|nr:phosphotransferase [Anaerolineaceae bacterium]